MSEAVLLEVLDEVKSLRSDVAALRAELSTAPKPVVGDDLVWTHGRRPKFWRDLPVRTEVIALHRQVTIDAAFRQLAEKFGPERAPSKSAIGRTWQAIDKTKRRRA
jgi:hypothetical protein